MSLLERLKRLLAKASGRGDGTMRRGMISCEEALAVIYEFLDGELDNGVRAHVQAHFDVCGHCYPKLRLEEAFRAAVRKAARGEVPPADLRTRLLDLLADAERGEGAE